MRNKEIAKTKRKCILTEELIFTVLLFTANVAGMCSSTECSRPRPQLFVLELSLRTSSLKRGKFNFHFKQINPVTVNKQ